MEKEKEIWVEMWNFPTYEVSNTGKVRRAKNEKELAIATDGNEYNMVRIFYQKKKYTKRLGRLIWQSFNRCDCKETIDHIDRNKSNDNINNLRCIPLELQYKNQTHTPNINKYNLTDEIRGEIQRKYDEGETFYQLQKFYEIPYNYIRTSLIRGSWRKYL